jgi:hypothetical protein
LVVSLASAILEIGREVGGTVGKVEGFAQVSMLSTGLSDEGAGTEEGGGKLKMGDRSWERCCLASCRSSWASYSNIE